jgi:hypothetical protein
VRGGPGRGHRQALLHLLPPPFAAAAAAAPRPQPCKRTRPPPSLYLKQSPDHSRGDGIRCAAALEDVASIHLKCETRLFLNHSKIYIFADTRLKSLAFFGKRERERERAAL